MKKIRLPDIIHIVNTPTVNGYGDIVALDEADVKGAFFQGTADHFTNDTDMMESYDAHCYVDETDPFVLENGYRLEGMYICVNLYGFSDEQSWYKIADVKLGVTKLLDNVVNNCHCFLQKCEPPFDREEEDDEEEPDEPDEPTEIEPGYDDDEEDEEDGANTSLEEEENA